MAEPTVAELSKQLADVQQLVLSGQTALNITWTLVTGFLVMFMQAGFALVETGLTRAKNVAHTMGMNFLVSDCCVRARVSLRIVLRGLARNFGDVFVGAVMRRA